MSDLAPVVIFTYNRPEHTRQTVEALQKNELAKDSDLIVFSDGPKNDQEDRAKVEEVRDYCQDIKGFKSVELITRTKNHGLANSIVAGVTEVVKRYGKVIVLEDDIVTSPYFLKYMNDGLALYAQEPQVISIHATIYPVKKKLPELFFLKGADCWGWATWRRGWDLFEPDAAKLYKKLKERGLEKKFDFDGSFPYTEMLEEQIEGNYSWAIKWYASAFLQDKLTLYPGRSLIHNIGFDASGTNCKSSNDMSVPVSEDPPLMAKITVEENIKAFKAVKHYFRSLKPSLPARIINKLKRITRKVLNKINA